MTYNEQTGNKKRIAKNTFVLYARSILVMVIALYTSRIILSALGAEDFGLYNVIAGVVGLFLFLRTAMEKCTQRFLNVEMVRGTDRLKDTFSVSLTIHLLIALFAFLLTETIGLWFLNYHVNIPEGREFAANCVYQAAVIGLSFTICTIPFSACIIAHEKMGFFAFVSIADAFLNLAAALTISLSGNDHLIFYSICVLIVNALNFLAYLLYCMRKFEEVTIKVLWEKSLIKQMLDYIGWTLFGHTLIIATNQGNIILVNQFFGVTVNAAMAIASQVNRAVLNFTNNFQTAFNPQITKSYAAQDFVFLRSLVYGTTKISYFLLTIISMPLIFNLNMILDFWLTEVPQYTAEFCILMIVSGILQASSSPLNFCVMSSGNIKAFQIATGLVFVSDLFILYALFSAGMPPVTAMYLKSAIMLIVFGVRLHYARKIIPTLTIKSYLHNIAFPLLTSTALSIVVVIFLMQYVNTLFTHIVSIPLIAGITASSAYLIGLSKEERAQTIAFVKKMRKKIQHG